MIKKTVVVTGGTKGLGAAIVTAFYQSGANVFIGARHDNGLAKKLGERAFFLKMNVSKEFNHKKIVQKAFKLTGRLDVYINNAGFSQWKPIGDVSETFWNKMIDVNLKGAMWGSKVAAKYLGVGGSIINIASLAGRRGSANNSVYCASKFGMIGLTQALAKELGSKGIRVNAICPVYVQTEGVLEALKDKNSPTGGKDVKSYLKKFKRNQTALGKLPNVDEIARTCLFFANDATAVTGQSLNVDCGVLPM